MAEMMPFVSQAPLPQILLSSSRDAMKGGGTLKISAHNEVLSGKPEGLKGEHVVLRVSDTGPGMPAEVMERVF